MSTSGDSSSSQDTRQVLEDLAAGRIDADEAARRIDALKTDAAADPAPGGADQPAAGPSEPSATSRAGATDATDATGATGAADTTDTTDVDASSTADAAGGDTDAWAASTDRPQQAGHARESVRPEPTDAASAGSSSGRGSSGGSRPSGRVRKPSTGGVERLSVRSVGRRVRIIGEPSVATVSADGPHVLRRNGSVLEISSDGEFGASIDGFQLLRGAPRSLDDVRSLGLGKELLLRVNPALLVDVEVTAGSLNTEGVSRFGSVRVTAGGAKLIDVSEITDALIQAGQATVKGAIATGRSRIRIESGSLNLQLADASNVTIATEAQLGKVIWAGGHAGFTGDEVVLGNGSAKLDVEVMMGHASIKAGTEASTSSGAA